MKRVPISELKARLSEYLAGVRAGEEIIVTDRGRPVARIAPVKGESGVDGRIDRLVRTGQITPPADADEAECAWSRSGGRPARRKAGRFVRFWDASSIVALCVDEDRTERMDEFLCEDNELAVWWATPVECASALARRRREGSLSPAAEHAAHEVLDTLAAAWYEVQAGFLVRSHALRLLRVHPLRSADALQLAAALVWAGFPPTGAIVTLDDRLAEAARLEGLEVLA